MDVETDFGWDYSAEAWIRGQGESGDQSRAEILDPALARLLPEVAGLRVLDVGCGEGRYCRLLRSRGARAIGIDPTQALIDHAKTRDPDGEYCLGYAESLPFDSDLFDLTLSYLSLIDVEGDEDAIREMVRVSKSGGEIILVTISNMASTTEAWVKDAFGVKLHRTVDRYMECFHLDLEWSGLRIRNYHRPLGRTIQLFLTHGCVLTWFEEPLPESSSPAFMDEHRVPTFQIMRFRKG